MPTSSSSASVSPSEVTCITALVRTRPRVIDMTYSTVAPMGSASAHIGAKRSLISGVTIIARDARSTEAVVRVVAGMIHWTRVDARLNN